jgi:AraC-like DNA-binding protein
MALLTDRNRTVSSVAVEVGFDSLSGFERAFRSLTGELPGDYRRRL